MLSLHKFEKPMGVDCFGIMRKDQNFPINSKQVLLLSTSLILLLIVVYWDFLTFTCLYLFTDIGSDTVNGSYPNYFHLANYLKSDGWPTWSFNQGMGQNIFPRSLGDPFELLLISLGSDYLAYGLVYVQVLRVFLAGVLFYLYLRNLSVIPMAAILGALLYAFSGLMILGGTWHIFSADVLYFALLLYAFERLLRGTWIYFPVGVALVAAGWSFNLYLYALFFLPYGFFRLYVSHGWQPRQFLDFFTKLVGLVVLGVGVSAVFFAANVQEMMNSPRGLGGASFFDLKLSRSPLEFESSAHYITAIMRLFSSDLLGTGSHFGGWRNYLEAPMFYCGLLPLLLAPQVFLYLGRRQKVAYAGFALVFLVPVVLPFFRYLFWAFAGDYYRLYSAFVALVFLFFGVQALSFILKTGRVHTRLLIATLAALLLMLFSPYLLAGGKFIQALDRNLLLLIIGLLLVYTLLVLLLRYRRSNLTVQWLLFVVVCAELAGFSWHTVNERPVLATREYLAKSGYNDYSIEAVAAIKKLDPGFYRIEKTYRSGPAMHGSLNDAKVQGYFGTTSYHSFNQMNYIRFMDALGVIDGNVEAATRWALGIVDDPLLTSFAAVKYVLVKRKDRLQLYDQLGYQFIRREGDVFILMNPNALPFGFTYDSYVTAEEYTVLPVRTKRITLMRAAVLEPQVVTDRREALVHYNPEPMNAHYDYVSFSKDIEHRRKPVFEIKEFNQKHIKGQIELDQPEILFFTLPFDAGWRIKVNGKPEKLSRINVGFSGLMLPAGSHDVELRYQLPYFKTSLLISIMSLVIFLSLAFRRRKTSLRVWNKN